MNHVLNSFRILTLVIITSVFAFNASADPTKTRCGAKLGDKPAPYTTPQTNPLLRVSRQPHNLPRYDLFRPYHLLPAVTVIIEQIKSEAEEIKTNIEPATFDNTIAAIEKHSLVVHQIFDYMSNLTFSNSTNEDYIAISDQVSAWLAELNFDLYKDKDLFARVKSIYDARHVLRMTREERRLTEEVYQEFIDNGVHLSSTDRKRLMEIKVKQSELQSQFGKNIVDERDSFEFVIESEDDLKGLPEHIINQAKKNAEETDRPDAWVFVSNDSTAGHIMSYCESSEVRKRFYLHRLKEEDKNEEIVLQLAKLRHEMAQIMGYKDFANMVISDKMAQKPENVFALFDDLMAKSKEGAKKEAEEFLDYLEKKTGSREVHIWDTSYWMRIMEEEMFDVDPQEVKKYFPLKKVFSGVLKHYERSFGLKFVKRTDIVTTHPDVLIYEVKRAKGNKETVGYIYFDLLKREGKGNGGHMATLRPYSNYNGEEDLPLSRIVMNLDPATEERPVLAGLGGARTLIHEIGHAMDLLLGRVSFPGISRLVHDAIELPSQGMEDFLRNPVLLEMISEHYESGDTFPMEILEKMEKASKFQPAWALYSRMGPDILDLTWHSEEGANAASVREIEEKVFSEFRLLQFDDPRGLMSTGFSHIFTGAYAAGYYDYIWADILAVQLYNYLSEPEIYSPEYRRRFQEYEDKLLKLGNVRPILESFVDLVGEEPNPIHYLRDRGLAGEEEGN